MKIGVSIAIAAITIGLCHLRVEPLTQTQAWTMIGGKADNDECADWRDCYDGSLNCSSWNDSHPNCANRSEEQTQAGNSKTCVSHTEDLYVCYPDEAATFEVCKKTRKCKNGVVFDPMTQEEMPVCISNNSASWEDAAWAWSVLMYDDCPF